MKLIVLGAAAGGGFPQWNCACRNCRRARAGDPKASRRTQSSLAVLSETARVSASPWLLLNASPDVLCQIAATPALQPNGQVRATPIGAVVLTNADLDHIAGLLSLRERQSFSIHATESVLAVLRANSVFDALADDAVARCPIVLDRPYEILGLRATLFAVSGKVPLYLEGKADSSSDHTVGVRLEDLPGQVAYYVPGCRAVSRELRDRLSDGAVLLFDGTVWTDDELIESGVGSKTGRRMGHLPISGPDGSIAALRGLPIPRKIFVHLNNTNPLLIDDAPERAVAAEDGWEVSYDGMEVSL